MAIIKAQDLQAIREKHKDKKIVFCTGSFDLTHAGHILFFEDCKNLGDILIVAVGRDLSIRKIKSTGRPILNQHIRLKTVDSLKPVDYCYINPSASLEDKFSTLETAFEILKPNIYAINQDAADISFKKELCEKFNINLKILKRTSPEEFEKISTSKIIEKIRNL